eukprot:TRINITY_DN10245_c0_g2_i1.p1 TRINITY_DN10245_c0_g2~~TRINITY_DN10245_c0_g2_i1.p1  ORF type:complete len:966 (-),score=116.26 TRINITY_DN10245_c0_g2_i1:3631-6528(-)
MHLNIIRKFSFFLILIWWDTNYRSLWDFRWQTWFLVLELLRHKALFTRTITGMDFESEVADSEGSNCVSNVYPDTIECVECSETMEAINTNDTNTNDADINTTNVGGIVSSKWAEIPNVAVERIWNFLNNSQDCSQVADVRLVCQQWRKSVSMAVEELTINLTTDPEYHFAFPCLKRITFAGPFNQKDASEGSISKLRQLIQGLEYCKSLQELDISSVPLQFELANAEAADSIDNVEVVRVLPKLTAITQLKLPSKIPKTFGGVAEALNYLNQLKKVSFPRSKLRRLAIDSILACKSVDSLKLQAHSRKVLRRVAQLPQLKELTLYSLSKDVGEEAFSECLKNLKLLELLRIDFSDQFRLTHQGVLALAALTNLRQLHLNGLDTAEMDLDYDNMTQLSQLTGITHLELSALGNVRGSLATFLPKLPRLVSLSISLVHPESWHGLLPTTLTTLWLSHDQHLHDLTPFQNLVELKHLSVTCCTLVHDSALSKLSTLTNLEKLQVVETRVTGRAFQNFPALPYLTHLALGPHITSRGFHAVTHIAPYLKLLKLIDCRDLDKLEGLYRLTNLTRMELMRCNALSDSHFKRNLCMLYNLEVLQIHGGTCMKNRVMSGECLRSLNFLPKLTHVEVNKFCQGAGDNFLGFPKMMKFTSGAKITRMSLRCAAKMNDDALAALGSLSYCLTYLDLSGCSSIKGKGLIYVSQLQKLKHLDLSYCEALGMDAAKILCGDPARETNMCGPIDFVFGIFSSAKQFLFSWTSSSRQLQTCKQCGKTSSRQVPCTCSRNIDQIGVHHDLPRFDEISVDENKPNRTNAIAPCYARAMLCGSGLFAADEDTVSMGCDGNYQDSNVENVKVLPQLAYLSMKKNPNGNMTWTHLMCLTKLTGLEYVDLDWQACVHDELMKEFSTTLNRLSHLSVKGCRDVTNDSEGHLRKFRNLRELNIQDTDLDMRQGKSWMENILPKVVMLG